MVSKHVELKYSQCFYSNTVYLQDHCIYCIAGNIYCCFIIIRTVYYDIMFYINIVEAHCHVAELTSSGRIDEQFTWHRNQEQNVSASGVKKVKTFCS